MQGIASGRSAFRGDINGLRAWAVVAVVLYHFGVPGFDGGFIGVDVFFVISGYLMTQIVVKELERGDFSLFGFYTARAKRIVPALLVLCAALLALGWFFLLPPDYKKLSTHAIYSLAFLSNVEYWQEAGYFDLASHEKWLLHTWSLSVEWQFYLLLPVLLWSAWQLRPGRGSQQWTLTACFAASLAACVLLTRTDPSSAFFLLHTRAWEILAGGLVFCWSQDRQLGTPLRQWLEIVGLLLILLSVAVFDKSSSWPGWHAILPVAAAMMVLMSNRSSRWTGNKAAQWLGDRSYSLYLWHWPVCVTLVYVELSKNYLAIAVGLCATLILGHLSYSYIENRTRNLLGRLRSPHAAFSLAAVAVAVALPAMLVWAKNGLPGRFPPAVEMAASEAGNYNLRRAACHPNAGATSPSCIHGGGGWKVIALGDSHVVSIVSALAKAAPDENAGVVQWSYSGCPFVLGMKMLPAANQAAGYQCTEFIKWTRSRLDALPESIPVVIVSRYAGVALGVNEDQPDFDKPSVYFSKIYPATTGAFLQEFSRNITESACELAKRRTVYMMRPIPEMGVNVPKTLSRKMNFSMNEEISISMDAYRKRNGWVWAAQDAARDKCGIKILDPLPYLCRDGRCYGSRDNRPLYYDDDHLSEFGNQLLVPMFRNLYKSI